MASALRNIIVVGGSFVGKATAQELAAVIPNTHRVWYYNSTFDVFLKNKQADSLDSPGRTA